MDDKTRVLISLGAATAANCIQCLKYYVGKADEMKVTRDEIQETFDLAEKVKGGASVEMRSVFKDAMMKEEHHSQPCVCTPEASCCG